MALAQWIGRWNRGLGYWNTGSSKGIGAREVKLRGTGEKSGDADSGAGYSSRETGDSDDRAALDGETVDCGSANGILEGQPGARADVMETRAEGWGTGGGTGSSVAEPGG